MWLSEEMVKPTRDQPNEFLFPQKDAAAGLPTNGHSTPSPALPNSHPAKFMRPSVETINENFDGSGDNTNYKDINYFSRPQMPSATSRDTMSSETTLMEPMHNKNDSYSSINSINSMDTMCSYRLKRFNSASSVPAVSTTSVDHSSSSSPVSPSFMSLSPTGSGGSLGLKKVAKFPLPLGAKLIDSSHISELTLLDTCLIIDVRPFIEFGNSHIKGAINFNLPSTLLKRPTFTLQKCRNNVSVLENVKLTNFLSLESTEKKVVFYDDAEVINDEIPLSLYGSLNKFINDSFNGELYVIREGFQNFKTAFPAIVDMSPVTVQQQQSRPVPHSRSLSLASISALSTPVSPNLSRFQLPKLPKTPVFKIRHNEEFYDFQDNYKVVNEFKYLYYALNHGPSSKLPDWFSSLFEKSNTLSLLEKFKSLEIEEKKRINDMISTNSVGSGIELGFKNRYKDIFPYEHSRVKLALTPTQEFQGYINANFINAPHLSNMKYIATQAPLQDTTKDFAKLCHDNAVSVIIVLTTQYENGIEKCYPYWEDTNNFTILETLKIDEIIVRRLSLTRHSNQEVLQIQIMNWSDYDVLHSNQQDDVLKLIFLKNYILKTMNKLDDNVIVHCSAGCGRTGTFCTLDSIINEAFEDKKMTSKTHLSQFDPIFEIVESFRYQRISMVQNLRQYLFIYDCLLNYYENFNNFHTEAFENLQSLDILNHYFLAQIRC